MWLWLVASAAASEADGALVIGISDYSDLPVAASAREDAARFRAFLEGQSLPPDRVEILDDPAVARASKIRRAAERLGEAVGSDGIAWVYFAGHAAPRRSDGALSLLGASASPDPEVFDDETVPIAEIVDLAGRGGARVLVVVDAGVDGHSRTGEPLSDLRFAVPVYAVAAARSAVWTAGPSSGVDATGGRFTTEVLRALSGDCSGAACSDRDGDGQIDLGEAQEAIRRGLLDRGAPAPTLSEGAKDWGDVASVAVQASGEPIAVAELVLELPQQIAREHLQAGIKRNGAALQQCWRAAVQAVPELDGSGVTLRMRFRVTPSGQTASLRFESWSHQATPEGRQLEACAAHVVEKVVYPASRNGTQVSYPLVFR